VEEVAARFGVTPAVVRQRLKLAGVSPALRARYRKGEMTLDHMMALAISDDHAAQEAAWAAPPDWNRDPATLKRALTGGTVPVSDRLARFVTVDAYLAAGGSIVRDLFDAGDEGYLADAALLQRLAAEKMEVACEAVRAEGWKWVEACLSRDYGTAYGRVWPQGNDSEDEDESASAFDPADIARAGFPIAIGYQGAIQIERGLIHPDDRKAEARTGRPAAEPGGLAASLVTDLSAHRTAALRIELSGKPAVALAAVVHAMALPLLYGEHHGSCLDLRAVSAPLDRLIKAEGDSPAHDALRQTGTFWGDRLPGSADDLLAWCLSQPQDVLLDLLAFVAALTVDAVESKGAGRKPATDALAQAVTLDMRDWWQPTVEGFWQRLPKAGMLHAMNEAKVTAPAPLDGLKKAEAAQMVAKAMQGAGWLPAPLREMAA
jgi:ParB family chromosome partitioning protein